MWELTEISLTTPLGEVRQPVLVLLDEVLAVVLPPGAPRPLQTPPSILADTASPAARPAHYGVIQGHEQEVYELPRVNPKRTLGDVIGAHVGRLPRRAFVLPPGQVVTDVCPPDLIRERVLVWGGAGLLGVAALIAFTWYHQVGAPWGKPVANFGLVVAVLIMAVLFFRQSPDGRVGYEANGQLLGLSEIPLPPDPGDVAARQVEDVKERYGQLLSDLAYRIEHPALFDAACPQTEELTLALFQWDSTAYRLTSEERARLACRIVAAFQTARQHADQRGLDHLPAETRDGARRALAAARLAADQNATSAEREAALAVAVDLLEAVALYYLPTPEQAREAIMGRRLRELPGRRTS